MQILGYLIFSLSLFYFFFLWQFPYDQLKKAIIQGFEEAVPLKLSITRMGPSFPCDLLIENIRIDSGALLFQLPDLSLHPNLFSFLWGEGGFSLQDTASSSRLRGEFHMQKKQSRVKIQLNNLEIKTSAQKEASFQMKLSGEGTFQWMGEDFEKGNGQAWALLERGEIRGAQEAQLPLPLALFNTIRAEIKLQGGILRVKRLEVSGKDLKGSFQGDFQFPGKAKGEFPDLGLFLQPSGAKR
jgi:type II secretion system protein N